MTFLNLPPTQARSQKCEMGGQMMKVEGQQVERRRCEYHAERRGGVSGGGVPLSNGEGSEESGEGAVPPSPENLLIFCLGMLHFGCNLMHFQT